MLSDTQQLGSMKAMKAVSSDRYHNLVKTESVMKAQAWVSDMNTMNAAVRTPQPLQASDAQSTNVSLMQPSVAKLKTQSVTVASSLVSTLSRDDTLVHRPVVDSMPYPSHSSTVMKDITVLGTPIKRVDSISASADHSKTSAVNAGTLHYKGDAIERNDYIANCQYSKQFDSIVHSTGEHYNNDPSELHKSSQASFKNTQQQTVGDVDMHHILQSSLVENDAIDCGNVNAQTTARSSVSGVTVNSQSVVVTSSLSVNADNASSLQTSNDGLSPSQNNARLNELWCRFSQDHTVCCPHATGSGATVNMSSMEWTSSTQQSKDRHREHAAGDKSQDAQKQHECSSSKLVSSNSLGSAVGHHNSFSDTDHAPQYNNIEQLRNLQRARVNMEDTAECRKLSKSDDARKVLSLSASVPVKHGWIVKDETLAAVPEDMTLDLSLIHI